jgi:hypothetical protein
MARDIRSGEWEWPPDGRIERQYFEGLKAVGTWHPIGRNLILGLDVSLAANDLVTAQDLTKTITTGSSFALERTVRPFIQTTKSMPFASRAAAYWGYLVDKVVGGVLEAKGTFNFGSARPNCDSAGAKC